MYSYKSWFGSKMVSALVGACTLLSSGQISAMAAPCFWNNFPLDDRSPEELDNIYQAGDLLKVKYGKLSSFYAIGTSECLFKDTSQEFCMLVIVGSPVVANYYNPIVSGKRTKGLRYVFISLEDIRATKGGITIGN